MDLTKRLDQVDEEMKLLKNEIKQVLLEIQEQVLAVENPFASLGAALSSAKPRDGKEMVAKNEAIAGELNSAPPATDTPAQAATPPAPRQEPVPAQAVPAAVPAGFTAQTEGYPEPLPAFAPPRPRPAPEQVEHALVDDELDAPEPDRPEKAADDSSMAIDPSPRPASRPKVSSSGRQGKAATSRARRPGGAERRPDSADAQPDEPEDETSRGPADGPSESHVRDTLDLATLAGLATWTDQVVAKLGRQNLDPLLELSELRGNLSKEVKEVILALARLFDGRRAEGELTAREMISLQAQLEALSGSGTPADARLLPFLIQGELEGLPLIRS